MDIVFAKVACVIEVALTSFYYWMQIDLLSSAQEYNILQKKTKLIVDS
jgi:hypothetical protein